MKLCCTVLTLFVLLAASSSVAQAGSDDDPPGLFDTGGIGLIGEAGSGFGDPFVGAGLDLQATSSKFYYFINTHLGVPFDPVGFYLSCEGGIGFWLQLGPIIVAPFAGVVFDGPPHESAFYAFQFGSKFEIQPTTRLAIDFSARFAPITDLSGVQAAYFEVRGMYRVNKNYQLTVGAKVAGGYQRGPDEPNTITTVFGGITL